MEDNPVMVSAATYETWMCLLTERNTLRAQRDSLLAALEYLVGESDIDIDEDYNPHARPLAGALAAIAAVKQEGE